QQPSNNLFVEWSTLAINASTGNQQIFHGFKLAKTTLCIQEACVICAPPGSTSTSWFEGVTRALRYPWKQLSHNKLVISARPCLHYASIPSNTSGLHERMNRAIPCLSVSWPHRDTTTCTLRLSHKFDIAYHHRHRHDKQYFQTPVLVKIIQHDSFFCSGFATDQRQSQDQWRRFEGSESSSRLLDQGQDQNCVPYCVSVRLSGVHCMMQELLHQRRCLETGRCLQSLVQANGNGVRVIAFSIDGSLLATAGEAGIFCLWTTVPSSFNLIRIDKLTSKNKMEACSDHMLVIRAWSSDGTIGDARAVEDAHRISQGAESDYLSRWWNRFKIHDNRNSTRVIELVFPHLNQRLFMKMTGKSNASDILSIPAHEAHDRQFHSTLRNFTAVDAEYFLKKYTKFMFVRHPFERLLSAYKNKLEQNYIGSKYFKDRIGKYIMQNYRTKKNQSGQANGEDITFEEFTNFLLNSEQKGFNEHWKPMHRLCEPCLVKYDFVGKYETLSSDANFILRKIGATNLSFPQALGSSTTAKQLKKYF
ncbi:unnamed protein product, partial [Nesidiocoris tenuis]